MGFIIGGELFHHLKNNDRVGEALMGCTAAVIIARSQLLLLVRRCRVRAFGALKELPKRVHSRAPLYRTHSDSRTLPITHQRHQAVAQLSSASAVVSGFSRSVQCASRQRQSCVFSKPRVSTKIFYARTRGYSCDAAGDCRRGFYEIPSTQTSMRAGAQARRQIRASRSVAAHSNC
eukprot:IDg17812t1